MRSLFAFAAVCCLISFLQNNTSAQRADGFWQDVAEPAIPSVGERLIVPVAYRTVELNLNALKNLLSQAPWEENVRAYHSNVRLSLPMPDGTFEPFRIVESPIMAPELAARYPEIRTYLGQGIDDPTATVRFDVTPAGFHAMIISAGPTVYIDPFSRSTTQHYISYYKHAVLYDEARRFEEIGVEDPNGEMAREIASLVAANRFTSIGEQLRTYRLALACTGEYATFHGGTKPLVLAEMVTAMNRVNGIYEREVAVRMVLIPNNDTLIYLNAATDPYTNNSGSTMLGQNQTTLDNIIGNANYDIGHVFSYTHMDLSARFQRMRGKVLFYPMGWDDNGLPTERRVQNYYGVRCDPTLPYVVYSRHRAAQSAPTRAGSTHRHEPLPLTSPA
ncbi:hypothetical protein FBQ87_03620, partial [Sphingobacteriales bacterium CHB3]|nr:hypothetical protein [Sphingobacteriales bacterium CHB3]